MTAHLDCVPSVMARSSGPYLDIYVPGLPMTAMGTLIGGSDGGTEDTESERGSKREKKKGRERERERCLHCFYSSLTVCGRSGTQRL